MTTIHTSRPAQYSNIRAVVECKLNNKSLSAKSCNKIHFFLDHFYRLRNDPVDGFYLGLYAGQKDVAGALADVAEMPECKARTALTMCLTEAKNVVDQRVEVVESDLAWQLLSQKLGLTGTQRLLDPEYARFLLDPDAYH